MNSEEFRAIYGQDPAPGTVFPEDQPRPAPAPGSGGGGPAMTPEEARAIYGDHPAPPYTSPLKEPYQGGRSVAPNAPEQRRDQSDLALAENAAIPLKLPDLPGPLARIKDAAVEGWNSYNPETSTDAEINQRSLYGKHLVHPLVQAASVPIRALGALGQGQGQAAYEGGNAIGGPRLGRDAYMLNQVVTALLPQALAARVGMKPDFTPSTRPSTVMERMAPRPIEGQTDLGRAIDLLRHDTGWEKPETPGYLPPGVNPNQPGFMPPGAALPVTGPHPAGVPDTLLGKALDESRPVVAPPPEPPPVFTPAGTPATSAAAKGVASQYYAIADKNGGVLTPKFTSNWLDTLANSAEQSDWGKAAAGTNPVVDLIARLEGQRGQPMTLAAMQEVDQALGKQITQQYKPGGSMQDAADLLDVQHKLRDQIAAAGDGDVVGGKAGFDALQPARKAWSQAVKIDDMERMKERADYTANPTTSYRAQVTNYRLNRAKSRGWSDDEIDALKDSANRGVTGEGLHLLGSKLLPLVTAGVAGGATSGWMTIPAWAAGHGVAAGFRGMGNALAARRFNAAVDVLNQGVPPPPAP